MAGEPHACLCRLVPGSTTTTLPPCHCPISPCCYCSSSFHVWVQGSHCPPLLSQLVVKEEERVQAPPSHGALPSDCHSSESEALEDISSGLGPREASIPKVTSSAQETRRPGGCNSEEEDTLPSLSFFLGSPNKLLPWQFPQSPLVPASGLVFPGGQGQWGAPRFLSHERQGRSRIEPSAAKSRKRALGGGPAPAVKIPRLDTGLGVSVRPAWALGPAWSSQPQKIMCASFDTGKRRRLHCSQ